MTAPDYPVDTQNAAEKNLCRDDYQSSAGVRNPISLRLGEAEYRFRKDIWAGNFFDFIA